MLNPVGWPPRHADAPSNVSANARHANACGRQHEENQRRREQRKAANEIRISPTDIEACLGRDKYDVYRPLYNVQVMTDLKTDLILAYAVSPCSSDSGQLIPLIDQTQTATGRLLHAVLTDSGYPSGDDLAACTGARGDHLQSLAGELIHREEEGRPRGHHRSCPRSSSDGTPSIANTFVPKGIS